MTDRPELRRSPMPWSTILGAIFLMATSAIGPGFLTQTALFTSQIGASFGFAILASIVIDIGAQLNIWRIISAAGRRTQDIGNLVLPGLGTFISLLVAIGGFAFNVGNVAGSGLGMNVMFGLDARVGAVLSVAIAILIFAIRESRRVMDRFAIALGLVMIALTLYVMISSAPPIGDAIVRTVWPTSVNVFAIVTIVGGTVGGYITFAGAHRLLDAGAQTSMREVSRAATSGILVTGCMRALLFLAALGVVASGSIVDPANPPASVFRLAAGNFGYRLFGMVMWAAAITSVVGASYTSTSFLKTLHPVFRNERAVVLVFTIMSAVVFLLVGRPVKTLVIVGALNAFVLPIALTTLLIAAYRRTIVADYAHPRWMAAYGGAVAAIMSGLAIYTFLSV